MGQPALSFRALGVLRGCCASWTSVRGLAFLGAVLLWASLPPLDLWPLAWIAPVPWIVLIRRKQLDSRRPYTVLYLAGLVFWLGTLHWLRLPHWATSFGWLALSLYFACYAPLFVGLSRVAVHRLSIPLMIAAPVVWTGLELARAHVLTGMSMASIAHTQYRWLGLIQVSDLVGEYGVTFLLVFVAAAIARMLPCDDQRRVFWPLLPIAVLVGGALFYGHFRMAAAHPTSGPQIALIQGSIDVTMQYAQGTNERMFKEYYELSRGAVEKHPTIDLVVWPESMFGEPLVSFDANAKRPAGYPGDDAGFHKWLQQFADRERSMLVTTARALGKPMLVGLAAFHFGAQGEQNYNTAVYVDRTGRQLGRYDKIHLVMFGEYVPLADYLPWLQALTPLPTSARPGEKPVAFTLGKARIAPNICYESVLSHVIRRQVNTLAAEGQEPDILINLTNDGWFWGSSALDMHLVCGVFRAVECRKPLLIAANTGFSAWIDGDGRIVDRGPRRACATILARPEIDGRQSFYLRYGDWFSGVCLAVCGLLGLVGLCRRKRGPAG